ncbi:hypothetical protein [Caballeronia telluris]|jgi:hypothetical protein|uniref:Transcriptional regulator n=1 Tax=Caballeronia telluris TaxID=326475 RepID=A0A158IWN1_9BURK|nr:hypothetical protein [Caballeronia telluris]SAL60986.1 hypothetical protein AWB66_03521 [Caballeronia telluris]
MRDTEVAYKNVVLIPLAAYDEGLYAAMLIVREVNGLQRASGVLGHFSGPLEARQFALTYGMAEIDDRPPGAHAALRQPPGPEGSMLRRAA